jgi:predicted DNA binding CopG/RHH family protein
MDKKRATTIPKFKSEAEEAAWWDRHPDFVADQFETAAKGGRIMRGVPKSQSVTIRIPTKDVAAARRMAGQQGLPYQTYIKMLLHQALERERHSVR